MTCGIPSGDAAVMTGQSVSAKERARMVSSKLRNLLHELTSTRSGQSDEYSIVRHRPWTMTSRTGLSIPATSFSLSSVR